MRHRTELEGLKKKASGGFDSVKSSPESCSWQVSFYLYIHKVLYFICISLLIANRYTLYLGYIDHYMNCDINGSVWFTVLLLPCTYYNKVFKYIPTLHYLWFLWTRIVCVLLTQTIRFLFEHVWTPGGLTNIISKTFAQYSLASFVNSVGTENVVGKATFLQYSKECYTLRTTIGAAVMIGTIYQRYQYNTFIY